VDALGDFIRRELAYSWAKGDIANRRLIQLQDILDRVIARAVREFPEKPSGNVEKSRQPVRSARRQASGVLAVLPTFGLTDVPLFAAFALTYQAYAPRVTTAAAFPSTLFRTGLDGLF